MRARVWKLTVIGSVLCGLVACGKKSGDDEKAGSGKPAAATDPAGTAAEPPAPPARNDPTPAPAKPEVLPEKHYAKVGMIFKTIVGGKLARAKAIAHSVPVYEAREGGQKHVWTRQLAAIGVAAEQGARAEDLAAAGRALGKMLAQCDACHTMENPELELPALEEPKKGEVARHGWGAMRMYFGLVGNDLVGFSKGAQELETAPFYDDEIKALLSKKELEIEASIRTMALEANEILAAERGDLFGEMVGQCAGCHAKIADKAGKRPGKRPGK